MSSLKSLIASGTKLWLDSVDPQLVQENLVLGATGATSNPIIIADLIKSGRFDDQLAQLISAGKDDEAIAWELADQLVSQAEAVFLPVWEATAGNDGYVSFELNPLLEDAELNLPQADRVEQYIHLGRHWSKDHPNRMIKIPATPAGIEAADELTASGVTLNVTLVFSGTSIRASMDGRLEGSTTAAAAGQIQERVQHLCIAAGRLFSEACTATFLGGAGASRHPECQTHLATEPGFLARQTTAARAGDHLCQHGYQGPQS